MSRVHIVEKRTSRVVTIDGVVVRAPNYARSVREVETSAPAMAYNRVEFP